MKATLGNTFGIAIVVLGMTGTMLAQGPGGGGMGPGFGDHRPPFERAMGAQGDHGRWWNNPKMVQKLNLTDAQRKDMDATLMAHREKLIDLHANLQKAELEMEPLMHQDQPNESAILSQIDKVASARAELEKANARFLLAIRSKLTPDQWKQLQALRETNGRDRGGWGKGEDGRDGKGAGGPGGEGRGNWQGHRPPPAGGQPGAAPPPPAGPQSMNELDADPGPGQVAMQGAAQ